MWIKNRKWLFTVFAIFIGSDIDVNKVHSTIKVDGLRVFDSPKSKSFYSYQRQALRKIC